MPKRAAGLVAAKVAKAAPGSYSDGGGLMLLVRKTGAAFWVLRFQRGGKRRDLGLGAARGLGAVTLATARQKAAEAIQSLRDGVDPIEQRRAANAAPKVIDAPARAAAFREVADRYVNAHEAAWRNAKHRAQWTATLKTYAFPIIGDLPVTDVETGHVMEILDPIWRVKAETASRVRGRIEAVLDYAKARGWRSAENPARWRGHLENLLPARSKVQRVEHHAAMPWKEIPAFMVEAKTWQGTAALALRFVILTAARSGEVLGATWREIDMKSAVWTVPDVRMKAGREHRVPLSPAALDILRAVAPLRPKDDDGSAPVFPGMDPKKPLSGMALLMTLRRQKHGDLTAHGFRSSFRDWCGEATNYPREVAEAALAHTVKDKAEAAYARSDLLEKRRKLMEAWATFCTTPPVISASVTPMRKKAG